jgi:glycosyltransferase involved in cell wall biosynthesis
MTRPGVPVWLKDVVSSSGLATGGYAALLTALARVHLIRGASLGALSLLLRAWRATGNSGFPQSSERMARALVQEFAPTKSGITANRFLQAFASSVEARVIRDEFAQFPLPDRLRLRFPRPGRDPERQGDLIVLKAPSPTTPERGVILIKYTEAIRRFAAVYDIAAMAPKYQVVLEPSSWGYQDDTFLMFIGSDVDAVVMSPWSEDFRFIESLQSNLKPVTIGAGDWVDPLTFSPKVGGVRLFDLVVVSSWSPVKRHRVLFDALKRLQRMGHELKVALIGYPQDWSKDDIAALASARGVAHMCTFFDSLSHPEVAEVVSNSRLYVLLSLREGANKALYESLFCDTPVLVYRRHRGVNVSIVEPNLGMLVDNDVSLPQTILDALALAPSLQPRRWAEENTGYPVTTQRLNGVLRDLSERRGTPWVTDIVEKKNAPELRYVRAGAHKEFEASYSDLQQFLR